MLHSLCALSLTLWPLAMVSAQSGGGTTLPVSADYRYKAATITNPENGYHLHCGHTGACEMAFVTIQIDRGTFPAITDFTAITMSGRSSARGATIQINNEQGSTLKIHQIDCSGYSSCVDTHFITGYDVALLAMNCAPGACIGCQVSFDATSPGIPCAPAGSLGAMPAAPPLTPAPVLVTPSPTVPVIPVTPNPTVPVTPSPTMPVPPTPVPTLQTPAPTLRRTPSPVMFVRTPAPSAPTVPVQVPAINTPAPTVPLPVPTPRPTAPVNTSPIPPGQLNPNIPPLPSTKPTFPPSPTMPPTMRTPNPTMPTPAPTMPTPRPTMPTPRPTMPTPAPTVRTTTASPTIPISPITVEPLVGVREFVCHGKRLCADQRQQIVNPQNGFYLFCTDFACTNTQIAIDLNPAAGGRPIDSFFGFLFQGESAAAGAIVTVNNWQSTAVADLGTITCSGTNACAGTQIIMGYQTAITAVNCGPGACPNCVVKTSMNAQPWPCDPTMPLTPTLPTSNIPAPVPIPGPGAGPVPVPAPVPVPVPAVNVGVPAGTEILTSPRNLECFTNDCASRTFRINNPLNAFFLYCGDLGSCRGSTFNLWYQGTGYTRLDRIECKGEESCAGATVRLHNNQRRDVVELSKIVCDSKSACAGATFDVGFEVAVGSMDCSPDSCSGCKLIVGGVSYPCDPQQA